MPWTTDTLDVLSEVEAKAATIGETVNGTQWDSMLSLANTAVSRALDDYCGAIVNRTVTGERHDGGARVIWLQHRAASAISSVVEYSGTTPTTLSPESPGTYPGTAFLAEIDPRSPSLYTGRLWRRCGGVDACFAPGRQNVVVTYTAGRYATTAAVERRFKQAASFMLKNYWGGIGVNVATIAGGDGFMIPQAGFPTFTIPNAVKELLAQDVREVIGLA